MTIVLIVMNVILIVMIKVLIFMTMFIIFRTTEYFNEIQKKRNSKDR